MASVNPEFGATDMARCLNQSRVSAVPQLNLITIKFGTAEARRLNWALASKAEERREPNNKAGLKRKVNDIGSSSKQVGNNRVLINVGLITGNEEGNLAIVRGSRVALKVGKDYGVVEVCQAAVKRHADHDQFFCGEEDYILLYPDQKPVLKVPGSDEDFSVAKYKQELAKPYSKVDLYICKETELKNIGKQMTCQTEEQRRSLGRMILLTYLQVTSGCLTFLFLTVLQNLLLMAVSFLLQPAVDPVSSSMVEQFPPVLIKKTWLPRMGKNGMSNLPWPLPC